jgi:hypothetical protein
MLQVVDEIDDAVGALRFGWSGLVADIAAFLKSRRDRRA